MFRVGLNPYGIAYSVGLFGKDTDRPNPRPLGLNGFLDLADSIGAQGIELPIELLKDVLDSETQRVRERIHANGRYAILMHGIPWGYIDTALLYARRFGFTTIRMHLTAILEGARSLLFDDYLNGALIEFRRLAKKAEPENITVTLENHQDLTSHELVEICESCGPNVGVCLDTGNPFAVGEDPIEFTRRVKRFVRHVHLKDYKIVWSDEGYRLGRCAAGCGAVDFVGISKMLDRWGERWGPYPASIECGALTERHIRLLMPTWWSGYPERPARELASALRTARFKRERKGDWRTPWDKGATPDEIVKYEMDELKQSVANLKALGLWSQ